MHGLHFHHSLQIENGEYATNNSKSLSAMHLYSTSKCSVSINSLICGWHIHTALHESPGIFQCQIKAERQHLIFRCDVVGNFLEKRTFSGIENNDIIFLT